MSVESIVQQIDKEISNLTQVRNVLAGFNDSSRNGSVTSSTSGRFSAAARAKMATAQKARWAKYRASKNQLRKAKPVRVMSGSARRKIAAAQKARWDAFRAKKGKKAA